MTVDMAHLEDEEQLGLCSICYVRWCSSPKVWCRVACFLTTITQGAVYAFIAGLFILDLKLSIYLPLLSDKIIILTS